MVKNVCEFDKLLTFQVKFRGTLEEENDIRTSVENFIMGLKCNILNYKARVLSRQEVEKMF